MCYDLIVIGGGPAGLASAYEAKKQGVEKILIIERDKELGGILTHGIPEFRLPREVTQKAIQKIIDLGINVEYNMQLGKNIKMEDLTKKYDAVFLAFGANIPSKMNIEGESIPGVFGGNSLLENNEHPDYNGKKVAVIGGGNVAMDCSRTIKKMGAEEVCVIYRRAEKQMPAERKEIEDAKKEGVNFLFQTNIVKINGKEKVESVECIKTELVKKDGESREVPVNIENSNFIKEFDYVIMAVGSVAEEAVVKNLGIELTERNYIKVDENYMTTKNGVFAGGDLIGGKATVAWAARAGRDTAYSIDEYLKKM